MAFVEDKEDVVVEERDENAEANSDGPPPLDEFVEFEVVDAANLS